MGEQNERPKDAITTRYCAAVWARRAGPQVQAYDGDGNNVFVEFDHSVSEYEAHERAVRALLAQQGFADDPRFANVIGGRLSKWAGGQGDWAWVFE